MTATQTQPEVCFLLPVKPTEIERLAQYHPDRDVPIFSTGVTVWILQTYRRLRDAGFPVTLAGEPPPTGIVVVHADFCRWLADRAGTATDLHEVVIRADRARSPDADTEVVQNRHAVDHAAAVCIPHWSQPGLVPRDASRGTQVLTTTFKGYVESMHPYFATPEWEVALRDVGIRWLRPETRFRGAFVVNPNLDWHDYATVDAIVGLRPHLDDTYPGKPASKLVNAWLAGVPAILGPEIAYRELLRGPLDYIEAQSPAAVLDALVRLQRSPELFMAMVENGRVRAQDFSVHSITQQWIALFERLFRQFDAPGAAQGRAANARARQERLRAR
jgi:hypothetical protein